MPSFSYVIKDRSGKTAQGKMDAATINEVAAKLRQDGYFILQLGQAGQRLGEAVGRKSSKSADTIPRGRVALKDKMFLTKQFYVMMKAGLGMIHCLNNLYMQTENKYLQYIIGEARKDIEGGVNISTAFGKYPKVFDKMFIHMLEAGEASGKLDVSFQRLSEYIEREYNLRKKVVGALTYPVIITIVAVVAVAILIIAVLPIFSQIFEDAGVELPFLTKLLLNISGFCQHFWFLLPIPILAVVLTYQAMEKKPQGKETLDKFWLKIPLLGDLIRKLIVARFTRTFSTLLESGVPLLQSLEIVENVVDNTVIAQGIRAASVSVNRGTGLAGPLQESGLFPPMVSQMVAVGEDTGDLSHMLEEVAEYYDKEVGYAVENLTSMIEPLIIVVLGGVVAVIVSAIMIPLFDISGGATMK